MRKAQLALVAIWLGIGTCAFAQESEFQAKMQEDLDYYKPQFVSKCGTGEAIGLKWVGKLGANPRETRVSVLCQMAVEAVLYSCDGNAVVKKPMSKLTSVVCTRGSGGLSYKLKGAEIILSIDEKYDDKNDKGSGQKDTLVTRIKKDLDR